MSELLGALLFATLSMQDAITSAIAHSPEIRALEAQVAQARANAAVSDAFRPSASISTTPGYGNSIPLEVLGQMPSIATVEAHKIFYDPAARAEVTVTQSESDAAAAHLEMRKREIAGSTAELYARVAAGPALVASAQRRFDAYQIMAAHTEALGREGRAREIDVNRAQLRVAAANRVLLAARSRLELDQLRLEKLTGVAAGFSPSDGGLKAVAPPKEDPQLTSLDKQIVALQSVIASQHGFKPTIAAQVQYSRLFDRYSRFYTNFNPDDFSVAASITFPIFTSSRRMAATERVNAQIQELMAMRDARRTELELLAREAETDVKQAEAERELAQRTLVVARDGLRIAESLASEGRGEANDVPLAQIALADAEDEVSNADAHVAAARARLVIARGELL